MDYRIENDKAFSLRGIKKRVSTVNGENFDTIPKLWSDFFKMETVELFQKHVGNLGYIGVCYNMDETTKTFDYMIAVERKQGLEHDLIESLEIPNAMWAVFTSIGKMPEAIQAVWQDIFNDFFINADYTHAGLPELEIYLEGDTTSDDYKCEIWIPVIEK